MSVLLSIGTARPRRSMEQVRAAELAARLTGASERRARAIEILYNACGVDRRGFCVADEMDEMPFYTTGDVGERQGPSTTQRLAEYERLAIHLAKKACAEAIESAGCEVESITHLVTVSCTGMSAPGIDHALINSIGLSPDVQRTHIGFMGCHGAINGLRVADALAQSTTGNVLLCCVELCSLHFQLNRVPGAMTANALFADGSAACIVAARGTGHKLGPFASRQFPDTAEQMGWRVGDHGFEMQLSPKVPESIERSIYDWIKRLLAEHELNMSGIDRWVIHPGGPKIVDAAINGLGLTNEAGEAARTLAMGVLAEHGNMSSPTVLFMLKRAIQQHNNETLACLAFGPGMAGEAVIVRSGH